MTNTYTPSTNLEISIVDFCDVKKAERLDPDFFVSLYKFNLKYPKKEKEVFLSDENYVKIIDGDRGGNYPNGNDFSDNGYCLFLSTSNVLKDGFELSNSQYISKEKDKILGNGKLKKNDIVFTTRGTIGNIGLNNEFIKKENLRINSGMVIFRVKNILSEYFFILLCSNYMKKQIKIFSSGSVQSQIPIYIIKQLKFLIPTLTFQEKIAEMVQTAHTEKENSQKLYEEAENILLEELDLKDWTPTEKNFAEKMAEEVRLFGRCDAEFFQPKYDEILAKIEKYKNGFSKISDTFSQNKKTFKTEKEFSNYIEISDVNVSNGEIIYNKILTNELPANAKRQLEKNDLLISKVRPYRGAVGIVNFDKEYLVGSGAFTVLQEKTEYKKEILMILLRTNFYKDLMMRFNVGSSYPVIKDEDILNLPIPKIDKKIQEEISRKITESHNSRENSKELLEKAKKAVEIFVEHDEKTAEEFLKIN